MAVSNFVFGSSTLKYDDVIDVILSEETCGKTLGGSTLEISLNAQRRGRMTKRGKSKGRGLNLEDQEIVGTMVK